jgi:diguanylate cyclase (GGDEF)-like protein/PAS domain S-box-containing protein
MLETGSGGCLEFSAMSNPSIRTLKDPALVGEVTRQLKVGIYMINGDGEFLDASPVFLQFFGLNSVKEIRSHNAFELLKSEGSNAAIDLLHHETVVREFSTNKREDGRMRRFLDVVSISPQADPSERIYCGLVVDITDLRIVDNTPADRSLRDPLTGSFNRLYLPEFEKTESGEDRNWGCIFIFIDHFKRYNDRYGIEAGEEALQKMSRFLMRHARASDPVIRLSDDEFLVIIPYYDAQNTSRIARRIKTMALGQAPLPFSLGWAIRQEQETLEQTIVRADRNMNPVRVLLRTPSRKKRPPAS